MNLRMLRSSTWHCITRRLVCCCSLSSSAADKSSSSENPPCFHLIPQSPRRSLKNLRCASPCCGAQAPPQGASYSTDPPGQALGPRSSQWENAGLKPLVFFRFLLMPAGLQKPHSADWQISLANWQSQFASHLPAGISHFARQAWQRSFCQPANSTLPSGESHFASRRSSICQVAKLHLPPPAGKDH